MVSISVARCCWFTLVCGLLLTANGCVAIRVPSARFSPSVPTSASAKNSFAPSANPEQHSAIRNLGSDTEPVPDDTHTPMFIATCPNNQCPPLFVRPAALHFPCLWPWCHHKKHESLLETELWAPIAKFHPVPTQPVFAPRVEYSAPQLLLEPAPQHPRLAAPRLLPHRAAVPPVRPEQPPVRE